MIVVIIAIIILAIIAALIVSRGYLGIMQKKAETTIWGLWFGVKGLWFRVERL